MDLVLKILQAILLLICMKYVQNLLLSVQSQGELLSAVLQKPVLNYPHVYNLSSEKT